MARAILGELRDGSKDADFSSQVGSNNTEDTGPDPEKHGAGLEGGGALPHLHADRLEVAEPGQRP